MRRAPDRQTSRSEALFAGWQVQDSNLRRHTPTDLQNEAAHAVTCGFTAPPPNFRTDSPRSNAAARKRSSGAKPEVNPQSSARATLTIVAKLGLPCAESALYRPSRLIQTRRAASFPALASTELIILSDRQALSCAVGENDRNVGCEGQGDPALDVTHLDVARG